MGGITQAVFLISTVFLLGGLAPLCATPYSSADTPKILDLIENERYEGLNRLFSQYAKQYGEDHRKEVTLYDAFRAFSTPEPWLEEN